LPAFPMPSQPTVKSRQFLAGSAGISLAYALISMIGLATALMTESGCLMPPATEEVSPPSNQPPRIVPDSLAPWPANGPVHMSTLCTAYDFRAIISDPDPDDKIYWRVFVDYYRDARPEEASTITSSSVAGESLTAAFSISPNDTRLGGLQSEPHLIELLVSDRPFYNDGRWQPGRAVPAEALTDSVTWTVVLTSDDSSCAQH
jgi:hypothetical protein